MRDVLLIVAGILAGAGFAMAVEAVKMTVSALVTRIMQRYRKSLMEDLERAMSNLHVADYTPSGPEYLELDDVMNVIRKFKDMKVKVEVRDGEDDQE